MQQNMDLKQEVIEESTVMNVVKLEKCRCGHCKSPAVFRLLIHLRGTSQPDVNLASDYRASSPTGEGYDQKKHLAETQERSFQEPDERMDATLTHAQTANEESENPFNLKEQNLSRRAIRVLLILFIALGVIVFFMVACHVYLEVKRSWDLDKCMNGLVKLCFVGMHNPPI